MRVPVSVFRHVWQRPQVAARWSRVCNSRVVTRARAVLNYRVKIYRKWMVKVWVLAMLVTMVVVVLLKATILNDTVNMADLGLLEFEERYTSRALARYPMSARAVGSSIDRVFASGCREVEVESSGKRANAAFVVLARNSEVDGVVSSMKSLERHFNQWFNYPWVFLNNERFSSEFKRRVAEVSSGPVKFGFIPPAKWDFEDEKTNPVFFNEAVESQGDREIMYGNMASYHKMCRFYSGFFFKHPLVKKLDWYWRVEPDVDFYCDLTYDPFVEMERTGKAYGFTIAIKELVNTVPNLFRYTKSFIRKEGLKVPDSWGLFADEYDFYEGTNSRHYSSVRTRNEFWNKLEERTPMYRAMAVASVDPSRLDQHSIDKLVDHSNKRGLPLANKDQFDGSEYNLCHFWSNFEIARTDLFNGPEYQRYFDYLEASKGFFAERWGDAPIHSLAAGMFLNMSQIHYFRDIGYKHSTLGHCPRNSPNQLPYSASDKYKKGYTKDEEADIGAYDAPIENGDVGVGCRCKCPSDHLEIEDSGGSCVALWSQMTSDEKPKKKRLDLDAIEKKAMESYERWLEEHKGEGSKWRLTSEEKLSMTNEVTSGASN